MNPSLKIFFGLIGGLAMFLYGMNSMSDALQKTAGERMRQILGFLTRNPIMGALAGAIVTAVLQSSSATTVMVIGFVSAGLMTLTQGISVIFGANIGTTMTAQLIAFKLSNYIYPIIFIGFILNFVSKKEKIKNIGMVIFSFGLLFEGIEIMGGVMKPLASSPIFTDLMGRVAQTPLLGTLLGACMTLVVQSSSATIAVLQNFASQAGADGVSSVIGLTGAIPILFGDNIGTTITALLASIGQSKNAKRTAIAHSVFNISGSLVFLCIIPIFARFVAYISPKGNELDIIARQIANAHTCFNIVCTLIWLPLIPLMVKIVNIIIRGSDEVTPEGYLAPRYLDTNIIDHPAPALYLVTLEITNCATYAKAMFENMSAVLANSAADSFTTNMNAVKQLQEAISGYITKLFTGGNLTEQQAEQAAGLLYVSNNIERIADRSGDVVATLQKTQADGKKLSSEAVKSLSKYFSTVAEMFGQAIDAIQKGDQTEVSNVVANRQALMKKSRKYNREHLKRVKDKICDPSLTTDYNGILYNLSRIVDDCTSIAEEASENLNFSNIAIDGQNPAPAAAPAPVAQAAPAESEASDKSGKA